MLLVATVQFISVEYVEAQTTAYLVTELTGADASQVPCKINNLGDLAGRSDNPAEGGPRAAFWKHSSLVKKHLGAFAGGDYSSASDLNDAGEIAGVSNTPKAMVPFLWTATGGLQRVPLLPGDACGQAISINKFGHVVGYSSGQSGAKAFIWPRKGMARSLTTLPGGRYSRARDVNDADEVAGTSGSVAGERAVIWTKTGSVRDLGTLPGDWASQAMAINNNGNVVGFSKGPRGMRAFFWTEITGMQDLGVLPGGASSRALDMSDLGEVVGTSGSASGDHAFIWTKETGMIDLNSTGAANLGVVLIEAHAINSKGEIIAMGRSMHPGDMDSVPGSGDNLYCAPAPPSTFLLTPTTTP